MGEFDLTKLKYDANGLIPAIVRDYHTGDVLMLAYMNEESIRITIEEGRTCFYSRSRRELWRKGATSGNVQRVVGIMADCDHDTLLIAVDKSGPACHTGEESCFHNPVFKSSGCVNSERFSIDKLYGLIEDRKNLMPEGSYTTYLFEKGKEKILKKVGEESAEVIIGAMKEDRRETVCEAADLCYHMLVLLANMGIPLDEVRDELSRRHIIDHKVKQETPD